METKIILSLVFGAGVILQILMFLGKSAFSWKLVISLGLSLLAFLPGKRERQYDPYFHLFLYFVFLTILVSFLFKDKVMTFISERTLLQATVVLWYLIIAAGAGELGNSSERVGLFFLPLVIFAIILSVISIMLSLSKSILGQKGKFAMYVLFLITNVIILGIQFGTATLPFFTKEQYVISKQGFQTIVSQAQPTETDFINNFLMGMLFFPIAVSIIYLLYLIPLPGKRQSFAQRIANIKMHIKDMQGKYTDFQLSPIKAGLVVLLQGGILFLNHIFDLIPASTAIALSMILIELMVFLRLDLVASGRNLLLFILTRGRALQHNT